MAEEEKKDITSPQDDGADSAEASAAVGEPQEASSPDPKLQEAPAARQSEEAPAADKPAQEAPATKAPSKEAPAGEQSAGPRGGAAPRAEQSDAPAGAARRGGRGARGSRSMPAGVAHVKATFNNTIVSITDGAGGVVAWCSGGRAGFKGSRKSTAFAATIVAQDAARQALSKGMREVEIRVQGSGSGRESAIRAIQSAGMNINVIRDVTPMPHNGCRPRKRRRV